MGGGRCCPKQTDRQTDRAKMAPKLSHCFNFSHLNPTQRMSNSGPCPDSHILPPFSGPLCLLLLAPHLRREFMDGSQPHPDTMGSSLPVFILERDGALSSHPPGRLNGRPTQVTAPTLKAHSTRACVCVYAHTHGHRGVGVPGSVCGARKPGSPSGIFMSPEQVCRGVRG